MSTAHKETVHRLECASSDIDRVRIALRAAQRVLPFVAGPGLDLLETETVDGAMARVEERLDGEWFIGTAFEIGQAALVIEDLTSGRVGCEWRAISALSLVLRAEALRGMGASIEALLVRSIEEAASVYEDLAWREAFLGEVALDFENPPHSGTGLWRAA